MKTLIIGRIVQMKKLQVQLKEVSKALAKLSKQVDGDT